MGSKAGLVGLSADSWMAWDKEPAWGVQIGPSASSEFALFLAENLTADRPQIPVPNIAQAYRDVTQIFPGAQVVSGEITVAVTYQGLENLFLHCFGEINNATAGTSGTYNRNFDLAKKGRFRNAQSKGLSLHLSRGVSGSGNTNPTVYSYSGCVIDSFTLGCKRDEPLKLSMNVFGRQEQTAISSVTPVFPTAPVANFTESIITWGSGELFVSEWSLSVKRNIDRARVAAGETLTSEPPPGQYECELNLTTEWSNEPLNGTTVMRSDFIAGTARTLQLQFLSSSVMYLTGQKYELTLSLPFAKIGRFPVNVSQRGRVMVPVSFMGYDSDLTSVPHESRLYTKNARNFADN